MRLGPIAAAAAAILALAGLTAPAYAAPGETPTPTATPATASSASVTPPSTPTPTTTVTPTSTPTPKATPTISPTPKATPTVTPKPTGKVTATYGCGTVTFHNGTKKSVLIHYGTAQSDSLEGSIHIDAGKSHTVKSTNDQFGWTAWAEGDQTKPDVGHEWEPGKDLSCDDTTVPPGATPSPTPRSGGGLANTGI